MKHILIKCEASCTFVYTFSASSKRTYKSVLAHKGGGNAVATPALRDSKGDSRD